MKKFLAIGVLLLVVAAFLVSDHFQFFSSTPTEATIDTGVLEEKASVAPQSVEYEVVEVARGLFVPWSVVFTSSERILISERDGYIRELVSGVLNQEALYFFDDISASGEEGLMGMALHPNYPENKYLYACYAYSSGDDLRDRVVRLVDEGSFLTLDRVILDDIPAARFHAGCRVRFGPDGMLYVTTGDASDRQIAQDPSSLGGKILRMTADGSIPHDNPFENSHVYSLGHRNPQGIDWDSAGRLYSSEHGPSGFDGPGGGDELNLIKPGGNYGWPTVSHEDSRPGLVDPLVVWTPAIAPGSLMVYKGHTLPQFTGDIFVGGLRGEGVYRVLIANERVGKWKRLITGQGRVREVVEAPNGEIYFTTSNRDGRGSLQAGDDKIFKISPVK